VSLYAVHCVCRDALKDEHFRAALNDDPEAALETYELSDGEREALTAGNVARLYQAGAHEYALMWLGRAEVFGLTVPEYMKRITSTEPHYIY
jgi:Aromatic-ring-opening dioxygenase LigAB, LigA subunit